MTLLVTPAKYAYMMTLHRNPQPVVEMYAKHVLQSGIPHVVTKDGARKVSQQSINDRVQKVNIGKISPLRPLDATNQVSLSYRQARKFILLSKVVSSALVPGQPWADFTLLPFSQTR